MLSKLQDRSETDRYPLLLGAFQWVGLLSQTEAESAIRGFKRGDNAPCEAVAHFGGVVKLLREVIKQRGYIRMARKRGHTRCQWPRTTQVWHCKYRTYDNGGWGPLHSVTVKASSIGGARETFWRVWYATFGDTIPALLEGVYNRHTPYRSYRTPW
jgi:hypothetical protein